MTPFGPRTPRIEEGGVARDLSAAHPALLRALLLLGCIGAAAVAFSVGRPEAYLAADAALARLLRGMALIKAALVLATVGALLWRFGHPITRRTAAVYVGGAWMAAGATVLVWQLTLLPLAAALFHAGEIGVLLAAWRDGMARATAASGQRAAASESRSTARGPAFAPSGSAVPRPPIRRASNTP